MAETMPPRAVSKVELASHGLAGAGLLFVLLTHTVAGLLTGLIVITLLHRATRLLHGPRLSHGVAKGVAAVILAVLAATATIAASWGLVAFARGHIGDLPGVYKKMADVAEQMHHDLTSLGVPSGPLEGLQTGDQVKGAVATWLRTHGTTLSKAGGTAWRIALHGLMGVLAAVLVFLRQPVSQPRPLAAALGERVTRFADAFERIISAQVKISAINTALTAIFLLGVVRVLGFHLPFSSTLVLVTFITGLLPVVGNLLSNTVIVLISFSVSPPLALLSLGFLVAIHKLEYLVNARIVGGQIGAQAWEIFLAIVVFEVSFGLPGVVVAPVAYAWVKGELAELGLV